MITNYIEKFREWLAYKIFPEFGFYTTAIKRMAEIDENERCVRALEEADSACSAWAIDVIEIKYKILDLNSLNELLDDASEDQKS